MTDRIIILVLLLLAPMSALVGCLIGGWLFYRGMNKSSPIPTWNRQKIEVKGENKSNNERKPPMRLTS